LATPRKHWFRVQDSILHEPWPLEVVGLSVKLMAYLNTRWAREGLTPEEACKAVLSPEALLALTVSRQITRAERVLDALVTRTGLVVEKFGESYSLFWPKFSEVQGFATPGMPRERPQISPSASASASAPAGREESEEEAAPSVPAAAAAAPPAAPAERWASLLAREPGTPDEKVAWLERELPLLEAKALAEHPGRSRDAKRQRHARLVALLITHWRNRKVFPQDREAPGDGPKTFTQKRVENTERALHSAFEDRARKEGWIQ